MWPSMAMPFPKKRSSVIEPEPGETKAHEAGESPDEEMREGSEDAAAAPRSRSRKRGAKNARHTKAPMDAEGGCCNEKKGKAKCSACAAGHACPGAKADAAPRRHDALTPREYLDACDLGIQGRDRAYIRARLDATQRLDAGVKCGGGYIAQGKKCKAGGGGAPGPAGGKPAGKTGQRLKTLAKVAAGAALLGGAAYMAHTAGKAQRNAPVSPQQQLMNAHANKAARAQVGRETQKRVQQIEQKAKSALPQHVMNRQARVAARAQVGREARAKAAQIQQKGQNSLLQHVMNRRAKAWKGRRDSVWAAGFEPRLDVGVKCGGGYIAQGKKCKAGAGGTGAAAKSKTGRRLATAAAVAGAAAALGGAAYLARKGGAGKGGIKMLGKTLRQAPANLRGQAKLKSINKPIPQAERIMGRIVDPWAGPKGSGVTDKSAAQRLFSKTKARRRFAKRDSVWASGFTSDSSTWTL